MTNASRITIKRLLKRTWFTFFSRYGNLLPIQFESIPIILEKKDAIVVAPTATGKTEAVVAPLSERLLQENWNPTSVVYLCPTKALVNDMFYRINEQLEEIEITVVGRTGDKPQFNHKKPPDFLITTPESFDSLLCRYTEVLSNVRAIVIDEIHLYDNTYRGDQIRLLLNRLQKLSEFNTYALSATIYDHEDMAKRYLKDFSVIESKGNREIEYTLVKSFEDVFEGAKKEDLKKLLIFCNTRKNVESVAKEASKYWEKFVVAHHGSLSKYVREDAEDFMKQANRGVCISTMTLEVGIDIGDIDSIVLADVPWSISSLLQRIGRGNRKTKKCRVFALYSTQEEREIVQYMLEKAKKGEIENNPYKPDLSVVIQQLFSIIFSLRRGLDFEELWEIFEGYCTEYELKAILSKLERLNWLTKSLGRWHGTEKLFNLAEIGKIHSNIPDEKAMKVINTDSSKIVGEITLPVDPIFALGGRVWRVQKISDKIYVKPIKGDAQSPKFKHRQKKGAFHFLLPEELKIEEREG